MGTSERQVPKVFLVIFILLLVLYCVESLTMRETSLARCSKVHMPASLARQLHSFSL